MVQINVILNLIGRETASDWPDGGVCTSSMGNQFNLSLWSAICPPVKYSLWMHDYLDMIKFRKNEGFHRTLV